MASCCNGVATAGIPAELKGEEQPGVYACFKDCSVDATFPVTVDVDLISLVCDRITFDITVNATSGTPQMMPDPAVPLRVQGIYSRTFLVPGVNPAGCVGAPLNNVPAAGNPIRCRQVWRFLINSEFTFSESDSQPCPAPPCYNPSGPFPNVHFIGHIDFSCGFGEQSNPTQATWRYYLSLSHMCGTISHFNTPANQKALPVGLNRHDDRSYHLVSPTPFTFLPAPVPSGSMLNITGMPALDMVRTDMSVLNPVCTIETPITPSVVNVADSCICQGQSSGLPIYADQMLSGTEMCGGANTFFGIAIPGVIPSGFLQQYIGQWGNTVNGMACVDLWVNVAVVDYTYACAPSLQQHNVYGVSTRQPTVCIGMSGQKASLYPIGIFVDVMTDFANQVRFDANLMRDVAVAGVTAPSTLVWGLSQ